MCKYCRREILPDGRARTTNWGPPSPPVDFIPLPLSPGDFTFDLPSIDEVLDFVLSYRPLLYHDDDEILSMINDRHRGKSPEALRGEE